MNENYLEHHGIKGQKWGVRNGPPYPLGSGKAGGAGKFIKKKVKQKVADIKKKRRNNKRIVREIKNISKLSDKDLDYKLNRKRKEKEYERILDSEKKTKTEKILSESAENAAKKVATATIAATSIYAINKMLAKKGIKVSIKNKGKAGAENKEVGESVSQKKQINDKVNNYIRSHKQSYDKLVLLYGRGGAKKIIRNHYNALSKGKKSTLKSQENKYLTKQIVGLSAGIVALSAWSLYASKNPEKVARATAKGVRFINSIGLTSYGLGKKGVKASTKTVKRAAKSAYYKARPLKYRPNVVDTTYKERRRVVGLLTAKHNAINENYLEHHGIKGQKWGVRNGPPYPLGSGSGKKGKIANKSTTPLKKAGTVDPVTAYVLGYSLATVGFIGISLIADKVQRKKYKKELEDMHTKSEVKRLSSCPKMGKKMHSSESMKKTNPGFPADDRVQNCTFCTAAMAMREKGYDVVAKGTKHPWYTEDLYKEVFGIDKLQRASNAKTSLDVIKTLETFENGSYGNLSVTWIMGGGHSLFWKKENGKVRIYDAQSGQEYSTNANSNFMKSFTPKHSYFCRLDNVTPNDKIMAIVEPRKQKKG